MPGQASIDVANRGEAKGWLVVENGIDAYFCVDRERKVKLENFYCRQDVIDAGITEHNCGFSVDLKPFLLDRKGDVLLSIEVDGQTLVEKALLLSCNINILSNSTFHLESINELSNWKLDCYHRIGATLNTFIAPPGLKFSDGHYTRLSFSDTHNTRSLVELTPEVKLPEAINSLQLALVAKASQETNLHIRIVKGSSRSIVYDDIFTLSNDWKHHVSHIPSEYVEYIQNGSAELKVCTKHYGRRFIDFAFAYLAEDAVNIKFPERSDDVNSTASASFTSQSNLLQNGDLSNWGHGIRFKELNRVQELADNWFIEFSKTNKGKLAAVAVTDNVQQDPLQEELSNSFGLRVRAISSLEGYARIILPFNRTSLNCTDHILTLDIECNTLSKRLVLPRIYLVARDAVNETAISDFARKQTVFDRMTLQFSLTARQVELIQSKAPNLPVLNVVIDIPSGADFTIYSATLKEDLRSKSLVSDKENHISQNTILFAFEDECINEQLGVLKGLDDWNTGKPLKQSSSISLIDLSEEPRRTNNTLVEFENAIFGLVPHKLSRPSRQFPFIDIIVPVYNACDDVLLCLSALIEKTDLLHRIIVVNDGDDQRTGEMLSAFNRSFNHLEVVTNPHNLGYTKSVNVGIRHSNADWVVVLNSDTIVSEGWLGKLMNCALSEQNVGMVGALSNAASWQSVPLIHDKNGDWNLNPIPNDMSVDDMAELVQSMSLKAYPDVGVINGFCQLINMDMLDRIGLLDERAFPVGYGEENDMCARAVKAGFKLLIADDTYVYHAKSKSFGHEKRKVLAKQGSAALKKKHPDVDWGAVTKKIFEHPALVDLRENLAKALDK